MSRRPCARAVATGVTLAVLTGCGGLPGGETVGEGAATVTLAADDACPRTLRELDDLSPAQEAPTWPSPERAWVCRYDQGMGRVGGGGEADWRRQGEPSAVSASRLEQIGESFDGLEALDLRAAICPYDAGPRWLLAWPEESTGTAMGLVVDAYGCHPARLLEAGEPVPGVLGGSRELSERLQRSWDGAGPSVSDQRGSPRPSPSPP